MSVANPFRVESIDKIPGDAGVFKMFFGKKYFIYKGKSLHLTVSNFAKQIDRELRLPKEDSILAKAIAYLKRYPVTSAAVEVLMTSDDPLAVLMAEFEALQAAKEDPECLNVTFDNTAYFPQWIPQKDVINFKKKLEGKILRRTVPKDVHLRNYLEKMNLSKARVNQIVEYVLKRYR